MVKLIASDLDGTLLLHGAQSISEKQIAVIREILDKDIIFAPASGRQMTSLRRLFAPVADRLMYISENGALVSYKGEILVKSPMDRALALDIIADIYAQPNCELLISGEHTAYIMPKSEEYRYRMTKVVNYHTTEITDIAEIKEDILKISVCDLSGIEHSREHFMDKWQHLSATAVSGSQYLDFTDLTVSKGRAMQQIQEKLGIAKADCAAFGDNYNDITLLDAVGEAYVMELAVADIKAHAKYIVTNVEETLQQKFL